MHGAQTIGTPLLVFIIETGFVFVRCELRLKKELKFGIKHDKVGRPIFRFYIRYYNGCGPGNSVGIATDYGLDGPGIESDINDTMLRYVTLYTRNNNKKQVKKIPVGTRFFVQVQTGLGSHPASCTVCTGSFPGVKRPGRVADHPPPSSAEV
jgi:hypothetical protein